MQAKRRTVAEALVDVRGMPSWCIPPAYFGRDGSAPCINSAKPSGGKCEDRGMLYKIIGFDGIFK